MLIQNLFKMLQVATSSCRNEAAAIITQSTSATQLLITSALNNKEPFFAGRLGWLEGYAVNQADIKGSPSKEIISKLRTNAGLFPECSETFKYFYLKYNDALKHVDLLALMRTDAETNLLKRRKSPKLYCELPDLEPYFHSTPWSSALAGLNVLIIHPFARSIESQYNSSRKKLFDNPKVLPEFSLKTIISPQTIGDSTNGFKSWPEAFESLCVKVKSFDYDVAIIGCGAYGFPLGAFVKSMGKVAIHLGGATQLLFGVSGKRWRDNPLFDGIINENWITPFKSERPPGWESIEGGCYW